MTETLRFIARRISETPDEVLMFSFSLLSLVGIILVAYWFYNRRKIHQLSHQIPASVVKNYLDSIIQNSSALKSSLFRGGGLEVGEGVPSVMPVGDLPRGNVSEPSGVSSGASPEELNQKIAEIASLTKRLSDKDRMIRDLEAKLEGASPASSEGNDNSEEVAMLKDEIKRLKKELSEALEKSETPAGAAADNSELEGKLEAVTKERDELKERLMEYEIIEEDLANLKRLQQENEQLKNQLVGLGKEPDIVIPTKKEKAPETSPEESKEEVKEESQEEPQQEEAQEKPQAEAQEEDQEEQAEEIKKEADDVKAATDSEGEAEDEQESASTEETKPEEEQKADEDEEKKKDSSNDSDQKSAEELLSEFERMLG